LYTKWRKFVPLQWRDEICPKPSDETLNRFKTCRAAKVKEGAEAAKKAKHPAREKESILKRKALAKQKADKKRRQGEATIQRGKKLYLLVISNNA
jgi:hypothetical protein